MKVLKTEPETMIKNCQRKRRTQAKPVVSFGFNQCVRCDLKINSDGNVILYVDMCSKLIQARLLRLMRKDAGNGFGGIVEPLNGSKTSLCRP